jgi:hypothetical protein
MSLPNPINVTYVSPLITDTFPFQYIVKDTDNIINIDSTHGEVHVILRNIRNSGMLQYQPLLSINDGGNNASTNNITIYPSEGDVINDNTSYVLNNDGANSIIQISDINQWVVSSSQSGGGGGTPFEGLNYVYVYGNGATPLENGQQFLDGLSAAIDKIVITNPIIIIPSLDITYSDFPDYYDPENPFNYFESDTIPPEYLEPYASEGVLLDKYPITFIVNGEICSGEIYNNGSDENPDYRMYGEGFVIPAEGIVTNVTCTDFNITAEQCSVIVGNSNYEFENTIEIENEYLNIVPLSDIGISFKFNGESPIGIDIKANNVIIKGISVGNKSIRINTENNDSILLENCNAGDDSFTSDDFYTIQSTLINCEGGDRSFGYQSTLSGKFYNCIGGLESFGFEGILNGFFEGCVGQRYSFSGNCSGIFHNCQNARNVRNSKKDFGFLINMFGWGLDANGTFTDIGEGMDINDSFGFVANANGLFKNCTVYSAGFGYSGNASGRFENCYSKSGSSFGGLGTASGVFTNCKINTFVSNPQGSFGSQFASGTFINCESSQNSFGFKRETFGGDGTASGVFIDCKAPRSAFGLLSASGTFHNCIVRDSIIWGYNFDSFSNASGVFINCESNNPSSFGNPTGKFYNCIARNDSFALSNNVSGMFYNCVAGANSFTCSLFPELLTDRVVSGEFYNCVAGDNSFGSGGNVSGKLYNCVAGINSFGNNNGSKVGALTGKLFYCALTSGTFKTVSGGGKTRLCIDGNDAENNQG